MHDLTKKNYIFVVETFTSFSTHLSKIHGYNSQVFHTLSVSKQPPSLRRQFNFIHSFLPSFLLSFLLSSSVYVSRGSWRSQNKHHTLISPVLSATESLNLLPPPSSASSLQSSRLRIPCCQSNEEGGARRDQARAASTNQRGDCCIGAEGSKLRCPIS